MSNADVILKQFDKFEEIKNRQFLVAHSLTVIMNYQDCTLHSALALQITSSRSLFIYISRARRALGKVQSRIDDLKFAKNYII